METSENELIARVGPGTPAGDTLRKYWLPVGLSSEIGADAPKLVRKLWKNSIETSLRGAEPPNLLRDRSHNRLVRVDVVERLVPAGELRQHVPNIVYVS